MRVKEVEMVQLSSVIMKYEKQIRKLGTSISSEIIQRSAFSVYSLFSSLSSTSPSSSPSSSLFEATRQIVHIINFVFWIIFIHSTCHEHWNWLKSIHPPHTHRHIATGNPSTNERTNVRSFRMVRVARLSGNERKKVIEDDHVRIYSIALLTTYLELCRTSAFPSFTSFIFFRWHDTARRTRMLLLHNQHSHTHARACTPAGKWCRRRRLRRWEKEDENE